jgi:hypothetical protein
MSVHGDDLADSEQPEKDDGILRKMMTVFKKIFEADDIIRRPTDTTAYRALPREDQIRFGT